MKITHQIWMLLGRNKYLYNFLRFFALKKSGINSVSNNTDLVIEGYPRTANTFAYVAIKMMQRKPKHFNIAHHLHAPYQIIKGIKYDIPCLLLIRDPIEAVVSLLIRENSINPTHAFKNYIKFHIVLKKYIEKIVISDFETTTNNIPEIVYTINDRYDESFNVKSLDKKFKKKCTKEIIRMDRNNTGKKEVDEQKVGLPTDKKEKIKDNLRVKILNCVDKELINTAKKVYNKFQDQSISKKILTD